MEDLDMNRYKKKQSWLIDKLSNVDLGNDLDHWPNSMKIVDI